MHAAIIDDPDPDEKDAIDLVMRFRQKDGPLLSIRRRSARRKSVPSFQQKEVPSVCAYHGCPRDLCGCLPR
jgi:hypothetical protein